MTKYGFVQNLSSSDVSGVLACCVYALREGISFFKALEELGFEIDVTKDFSTQAELCQLAFVCVTYLTFTL